MATTLYQLKAIITDILFVNIDCCYQLDDDITECWFVLQNFPQYFNRKFSQHDHNIQDFNVELSIPGMANDKLDYVNAPSTNDQFTDQRDFTIEDIPAKNIDQQIEIQELDLALEDDLNRLMQRVKYERCFLEM